MSLDIQERDREGITMLDLDGRLTVGNEMGTYRETMQKLIDAGKRSIVNGLAYSPSRQSQSKIGAGTEGGGRT